MLTKKARRAGSGKEERSSSDPPPHTGGISTQVAAGSLRIINPESGSPDLSKVDSRVFSHQDVRTGVKSLEVYTLASV